MSSLSNFLEVKLTDDELQHYGQEQASIIVEIRNLDEEKKVISQKQKPLKDRVQVLASAIDSGVEYREVECTWVYNWDKGTKQARRIDTGHFSGGQVPIEPHERQEPLL